MNGQQVKTAMEWYKDHKEHVDVIIKEGFHSFPPTEVDDKNDPRIWKPSHWRWFLENYKP